MPFPTPENFGCLWRRSGALFRALLFLVPALPLGAQFVEEFEAQALAFDTEAWEGWAYLTGDGEAEMTFQQEDGSGVVEVDAREDRRNIWWAYIRRAVSPRIDQKELSRPDRELRLEARIRVSHAPRRVNLHFNHSRTDDFHTFLKEYDIPDTENWHVISLTTQGFDARPDDEIYAQLALMDWGREQYQVEIDYFKVEVVDPAKSGPDLGDPLPYRPAPRPASELPESLPAAEDATVDQAYPWVNLSGWTSGPERGGPPLMSISGSQIALLRWDLSRYRGRTVDGWGLLELTTETVHWAETDLEEFGELRVVEILGGDADWTRDAVTFESFVGSAGGLDEVLNGQMVIDIPPAKTRGGKTRITLSPPVLNRLLSGESKGLAIYPQGALNAAFYSNETDDERAPRLRFALKTKP